MRAIDFHVHPCDERVARAWAGDPADAARFFRGKRPDEDLDATAERYRKLDLFAVLLGADAETTTGVPAYPNDELAAACQKHSDVFVGFEPLPRAPVDRPTDTTARAIAKLAEASTVRIKAAVCGFTASGSGVVFADGYAVMMAAGAGTPGGRGQRLDFTRPIYLDHLAADFPNLTIIAAHPSWPWADEGLAVARHKSNVFLDLSGYSPKYIPPQYVQFANTLLQDQMLFGSDYPFITPERWLDDFPAAGFRDEVHQKILLENARRVLGLPSGKA